MNQDTCPTCHVCGSTLVDTREASEANVEDFWWCETCLDYRGGEISSEYDWLGYEN